jgi:hypothetical protein
MKRQVFATAQVAVAAKWQKRIPNRRAREFGLIIPVSKPGSRLGYLRAALLLGPEMVSSGETCVRVGARSRARRF